MLVSQPLVRLPSQSAHPALHRRIPQAPPTQLGTALGGVGQRRPHAPQWLRSVSTEISQPLALFMSQSSVPVGQDPMEQVPARHTLLPAVGVGQELPHRPQLSGSKLIGVSHPSSTRPLQFAKPELHAPTVHIPALHTGVPLATPQRALHTPQ